MEVERAFSQGGLTIFKLHHSLSDTTIRASTLLSSWVQIPRLMDKKNTISMLKAAMREHAHLGQSNMDATSLASGSMASEASSTPVTPQLRGPPKGVCPVVKAGTSLGTKPKASESKGVALPTLLVQHKSKAKVMLKHEASTTSSTGNGKQTAWAVI